LFAVTLRAVSIMGLLRVKRARLSSRELYKVSGLIDFRNRSQ